MKLLHVGGKCLRVSDRRRGRTVEIGEMTDLISFIPHPHEILSHSNEQHAQLLAALRQRNAARALAIMADHLHGTEHVLAGLLRDA